MTRSCQAVSETELQKFENAVHIIATKAGCKEMNYNRLKEVGAPIVRVDGLHVPAKARCYDFDKVRLEPTLYLCKGCKVMLTRNMCTDQGLTNGALGIVHAIIYDQDQLPPKLPAFVVVEFEDFTGTSCLKEFKKCFAVAPVKQTWRVGSEQFSREQLPLQLSYAITIYKSEGLTFKKVFIDVERKTWAPQMLYVAISRVKKLQDLIIAPFDLEYVNHLGQSKFFQQRLTEEKRLVTLAKKTKKKHVENVVVEPMEVDECSNVDDMDVDV